MRNFPKRAAALLLALLMSFASLTPASFAAESTMEEPSSLLTEEVTLPEADCSVSMPEELPTEQAEESASEEVLSEPAETVSPAREEPAPASQPETLSLGTVSSINPLYRDVISEPVAPAKPDDGPATLASTVYTSVSSVGDCLRKNMCNRVSTFSISYRTPYRSNSLESYVIRDFTDQFFQSATRHTGIGTEGDYLKWSYGSWSCSIEGTVSSKKDTITYGFTYTISYYTTAAQEKALTAEVDRVLSSLSLEKKSEYGKVFAIYDYICRNVTYDNQHLNAGKDYPLQFTAYAALINGSAVCQGYSALFYRMALDSGLDARILSSQSLNHGWNLVKVDGRWYELDSTWDSQFTEDYRYFLRSTAESGHILNQRCVVADEYNQSDFRTNYPVSATSYNGAPLSGETKNGLLWTYLPESRTLRITGKGSIPDCTGGAPWADCLPLVKRLVLGSGITEVGASAFRDAPLLLSVSFPDTLDAIGEKAFYGCVRLKDATLPPSVQTIAPLALGYAEPDGTPEPVSGFILRGTLGSDADRYASEGGLFFESSSKILLNKDNTFFAIDTPTLTYNAAPQTPRVTLQYLGQNLIPELDYTLSCKDNLNAGTASVTVSAVGRYSGSFTGTFTIKAQKVSKGTISLSSTSYTYSGKAKKPSVTLTLSGIAVPKENFTLSYSDNTKVGTATVTVKGKGSLSGSAKATFTILPKAPTLSSVKKSASGKLSVKWKKVSGVSGYRVQYGTSSKFSGASTKSVSKAATVSASLTKLKKGKKYYVRVQSWQTVSGKKYYSKWSSAKNAKA